VTTTLPQPPQPRQRPTPRSHQQRQRRRRQRLQRQRQLRRRQQRLHRRLSHATPKKTARPLFDAANIHYQLSDKTRGLDCGGLGTMHLLAHRVGLPQAIDQHLHLLKFHLPYHESDHVLNLAYNVLAGGTCLQDLERRRHDENYLDALDTPRIPDPTTAGDFCRRFGEADIRALLGAIDQARQQVWAEQPQAFFDQATIDLDGVIVPTSGECKQGIDLTYNGQWGYHPLVISLAETGEVLSLVNRSGNRPSHEGAAAEIDRLIPWLQQAGFRRVRFRGDTDFSQTQHLDRWAKIPGVLFYFGLDASISLQMLADELPASAWQPLPRRPRYEVQTQPRRRPINVKEQIVRQRGFKNLRLESVEVAQMSYQPSACRRAYRLVVVKKNLIIEKGGQEVGRDYRYFFYLTNDQEPSAADIVAEANQRCHQENLNAQLLGGVQSLAAPVDTLLANGAYMVMTTLAWNLKAWWALLLPESPGRYQEQHRQDKRRVLRLEFKTFVQAFMQLPCQIVRSGGRLIYRLLAWNPWQEVFWRLVERLSGCRW
jgi:Transposase DDE domain group 1